MYTDIFHHTGEHAGKLVRSHRLSPSEWVTIFIILTGDKESITSILEDHILESISQVEWSIDTIDTDFTFVSENFNHFMQNIDESDRSSTWVILAVLIDDSLVFSHIGDTGIILVEQDGTITSLSNNDPSKTEFHAVSSGEVLAGSHIYLSSSPLENRLSDDLIRDLSALNTVEWKNIIGDVFRKEIQDTIHIAHISHEVDTQPIRRGTSRRQMDILRTGSREVLAKLRAPEILKNTQSWISELFQQKQQETKYLFLWVGIFLLFTLLYFLFSAIFSVVSSPERDSKNQLIQAQKLIDNSQKLVTNPVAFNKSISEAEKILFVLRDKRVYMADTQSLLSRIEAMKKEVNDIQTIDVSKLNAVMKWPEWTISPIGIFEYNKKLNLIGETNSILWYARGEQLPKGKTYPTGEKWVAFDVADDGSFYIVTDGGNVLTQRGDEISYVTSNGKNEWNTSPILNTFNGNVYLIGSGAENVLRYKPGINGFSTPTSIISGLGSKIVDLGIDGGIYTLLQDGKVIRYIGGTTGWQKSLSINKVPGEYNIGNEERTELFVKPNLSYIYILSGKNVWIFAPDSKRFQDVTAWNYVAQLELQTPEDIRSISVPRDGLLYIVTAASVYELAFEVADGKIILR
jgi:hypothetical protein